MSKNALAKVEGMVPLDVGDASWKDELGEHANRAAQAAKHATDWAFIRTKGGRFTYMDEKLPDTINVVVVGVSRSNEYYEAAYDADELVPPDCFAVGFDEKTLAPPADHASPQHAQCKGCPMNEYGSASKGKGKACRNQMRLALLPIGDSVNADVLGDADGAMIRVPPTSLQNFSKYVSKLDTISHLPQTVVTRITISPHDKKQFELTFEPVGGLDAGLAGVIKKRADDAEVALLRLPDVEADEPVETKSGTRAKY